MDYKIFTSKSRADKAINTLKGITQGILLDEKVTDAELIELKKWASDNLDIRNKRAFFEFMLSISEIDLEDVNNRIELVQDIFWLCQKIEQDGVYYDSFTSEIQTMIGVFQGIISDKQIEDNEVIGLKYWLLENQHLEGNFIYDKVLSTVLLILEDGVVDEVERTHLQDILNEFALSKQEKSAGSNSILFDHVESIDFESTVFVLTGEFNFGTRSKLNELITSKGGLVKSSPSKKTDYVVIGSVGNDAWCYTRFGRKVEKALSHREEGFDIKIINENSLMNHLI